MIVPRERKGKEASKNIKGGMHFLLFASGLKQETYPRTSGSKPFKDPSPRLGAPAKPQVLNPHLPLLGCRILVHTPEGV